MNKDNNIIPSGPLPPMRRGARNPGRGPGGVRCRHFQAEFAVVVRSDLKDRGLGCLLLDKLIRYCRERGVKRIVGQTLPRNTLMLQLAKGMGFREEFQAEEKTVALSLELQ